MNEQDLKSAFDLCVKKTRDNIEELANCPKSYAFAENGNYFAFEEGFNDIGNWTSSFFTGMAMLSFETTGDRFFLKCVNQLFGSYHDKVFKYEMDTMHDLGFLYTLYSVALYKLTGDSNSRTIALKAADELAKRFSIQGGYIRAWGRMDDLTSEYAGLAIIDCMMNLPLLFWAGEETGNGFYRDIAIKHADITLNCFIRNDDSVYHAYRFDITTGKPVGGDNYCGYSVDSHWARGTAWAIYGFALAYGYTKEHRYLEASKKLADQYIKCLDDDLIPVWDFKLPEGNQRIPDSSAAAIMVCGFYELLKYDPSDSLITRIADETLAKLCSQKYLDNNETCTGVLKNAEVGDGTGKAKNAYTSWGDYFLMEALAKKLYGVKGYW